MHDLIIIGSGPAGLTAAIYAARAEFHPLVLAGRELGGQLTTTTEVENYPGFPKGILGPELMRLFREQAERFGAKIVNEEVTSVDFSKRPFKIVTEEKKYQAQAVIVATGSSPRHLGLPSEEKLYGRGVSYCATCDGPFFKNKIVAVAGGGDTAIEEANFLSRFASQVYLIHRRDALRASKIMQEKVFKNQKIKIIFNKIIEEILDVKENRVTGLRLKDVKTNQEEILPCDGLFMAIGHIPQTKIFAKELALDANGYIMTDNKTTKTNKEGIFSAGDCADPSYRQASVAVGTGCKASLDAQHYLEDLACQRSQQSTANSQQCPKDKN